MRTRLAPFATGIAICLGIMALGAWLSMPPRHVDGPTLYPTDAAVLCAEVRGNGNPEAVSVYAQGANVPPILAASALAYAEDPTPGALQRLQQMCP